MATKEREEIKGTTKEKNARPPGKEGRDYLQQESNRKKTIDELDGGLHSAVDGQSLCER